MQTKLAKMEAALAAKERERQEAEEAARRQAEEEEASRDQKHVSFHRNLPGMHYLQTLSSRYIEIS